MSVRQEPLLAKEKRYALRPILYPKLLEAYITHSNMNWYAAEIPTDKEALDFQELDKNEQAFVKNILAFFAISDKLVNKNLVENFTKEISLMEARFFYDFQAHIENVHAQTYMNMLSSVVTDENEIDMLANAVETIPCIGRKASWVNKWMDQSIPFAERLIAFAIIEGVFFSGSFCAIYWLKNRKPGKLNGLVLANDFIAKDESMHTSFACLLYEHIVNKVSQQRVEEIMRDAVAIETDFIIESIPCALIGMNSTNMAKYIQFMGDRLCQQLGYEKIYKTENPFPFMDMISIDPKVNFFEHKVTNYTAGKAIVDVGKIPIKSYKDARKKYERSGDKK